MTAVAELLEYLTDEERSELDGHLVALTEPVGTTATLREFVTRTEPRYRWYRHCEELARALQAVADGEISRLMVFMPPRHGKSLLVSRRFPAYYLRRHPSRWVGLASYEATLAQDFSRTARDAFVMDGGQLRGDSKAVDLWQTTQGGGMWAVGVGGALTGKGGDLLVIDDPIKNDEEAASATIREKHKSWYDATFSTREEPDGSVVIVQTRWNEEDLSGYLLAKEELEPEGWVVLNLPAIAEGAKPRFPETCSVVPDWRSEGQALCPERYDESALAKIKNRVGSYFWSALYQQRPTPVEGGTFKRTWWRYYQERPLLDDFSFICQSWDMSFKDTDSSDFVVGQVWGLKGPDIYLLDQFRQRMDFPTTVRAVRELSRLWPQAVVKYVEEKANGAAVIQTLQQRLPGLVAINPEGGKESRAAAVAPLVEAQNVYLPPPALAPWVTDFVEECAGFPNGANDDQVDAMSQALTKLGPMANAFDQQKKPAPKRHEDTVGPTDFGTGKPADPIWQRFEDQMRKQRSTGRPRRHQTRTVEL